MQGASHILEYRFEGLCTLCGSHSLARERTCETARCRRRPPCIFTQSFALGRQGSHHRLRSVISTFISLHADTFRMSGISSRTHSEELLGCMPLVVCDRVQRPRARLVPPDAAQGVVAGHELDLQGFPVG